MGDGTLLGNCAGAPSVNANAARKFRGATRNDAPEADTSPATNAGPATDAGPATTEKRQ